MRAESSFDASADHRSSDRQGRPDPRTDLDIAEANVLQKGFAATSLDEIIFEAGLTKSGFFYHFRDKTELARADAAVRPGALADMLSAVTDGGIVLSKAMGRADLLGRRICTMRTPVRATFTGR